MADAAETAYRVLQRIVEVSEGKSSEKHEKNPAAVALGRLGGLKGGKKGGEARARKLTKKRRVEIAKKAAAARWKKQDSSY